MIQKKKGFGLSNSKKKMFDGRITFALLSNVGTQVLDQLVRVEGKLLSLCFDGLEH